MGNCTCVKNSPCGTKFWAPNRAQIRQCIGFFKLSWNIFNGSTPNMIYEVTGATFCRFLNYKPQRLKLVVTCPSCISLTTGMSFRVHNQYKSPWNLKCLLAVFILIWALGGLNNGPHLVLDTSWRLLVCFPAFECPLTPDAHQLGLYPGMSQGT